MRNYLGWIGTALTGFVHAWCPAAAAFRLSAASGTCSRTTLAVALATFATRRLATFAACRLAALAAVTTTAATLTTTATAWRATTTATAAACTATLLLATVLDRLSFD